MTKSQEMCSIEDEIQHFIKSPLYKFRKENHYLPVIGEGSLNATIMLIGEAPGKKEAETGKPFCGASGKFLTVLIESIGLKREEVYITNLVKDRPPENRDPAREEIALYTPFLDRQIELIQPKVIATLGRYSMAYILEKYSSSTAIQSISKIHGNAFQGKASYGTVYIVTLYHPAVALYNGGMRKQLLKDFLSVKQLL